MQRTFFLMVMVLTCLVLSAPCCVGQDNFKKAQAVDRAVVQEMKRQNIVGAAIGIIRNSRVVYTKGYGYSNLENETLVTSESVFNWASNSKPVIAVAAMQLVQQGQLDLDSAIDQYLVDCPDQFSSITTRQLLCHQSGIPHYTNGRIVPSGEQVEPRQELDPLNAIHRFSQSPLIFDPGTKTDYSSYAYVLLSAVVQSAGEEKIEKQLLDRIGKPLELNSFQLDVPFNSEFKSQENWVCGYKVMGRNPVAIEDYAHYWKHGAGGYKSDVRDFAKFASALASKKLIDGNTTRTMWTNQTIANGTKSNYGLGVVVGGERRDLKISHGGSQDEVRTRMVVYPNQGHGVVVMCNTQGADAGRISTAIYSAMKNKK